MLRKRCFAQHSALFLFDIFALTLRQPSTAGVRLRTSNGKSNAPSFVEIRGHSCRARLAAAADAGTC